jgi:hypothetical protein
MPRLLAVLVVVLAGSFGTRAAPVPKHLMKEPVYYYPTQVRAKWVYQFHAVGDPAGREVIEIVLAVEEQKGLKIVSLGSVVDGKPQSSGRVMAVSGKGLIEGSMVAPGDFDARVEVLRLAALGTRWEVMLDNGRAKYTLRGEELVEVPAGKFKALRVDGEFVFPEGGRELWRTWYAPGVGVVKWEDSIGRLTVLKGTAVGK